MIRHHSVTELVHEDPRGGPTDRSTHLVSDHSLKHMGLTHIREGSQACLKRYRRCFQGDWGNAVNTRNQHEDGKSDEGKRLRVTAV